MSQELGRTKFDKALEFLKESRKIGYAVIAFIAIFGIGWLNIDIPYISPFVGQRRFFFIGLIVGSIILYIPSKWLVKQFYTVDSDIIYAVNENPQDDNARIKEYEVGKDKMNRMKVDGKTPLSWRGADGKQVYLARKVDLKNDMLITTHHAEKTDIEMMEYADAVKQARLRMRKQALKGIKLHSRFEQIVENIEAAMWTQKTNKFLESAYSMKDTVNKEVESEIKGFYEKDDEENSIQDLIDSVDVDVESVTIGNGKKSGNNNKQSSGATNE